MAKDKKKRMDLNERQEMMRSYHFGKHDLRNEAMLKMIDALDDYIHYTIHNHFSGHQNIIEDLIQSGRIAILKHMDDYNPQYALTTFFKHHIQNEMQALVNNENNESHYYALSKVTITKNMRKLNMDLEHIDEKVLAESMGISIERLKLILQNTLYKEIISLSDCDLNRSLGHMNHPEAILVKNEENAMIHACIDLLDEDEQIVICMYFGFYHEVFNQYEKTYKLYEIQSILDNAGRNVNAISKFQSAKTHIASLLKQI